MHVLLRGGAYAMRTDLCRAVARTTYAAFAKEIGENRPPVPVWGLAAWLGFHVIPLFAVPDEFSAIVSTREQLIGINGRHHPRRQRFSICHELSHVLLHHPPESRCAPAEVDLFNAEADESAAGLIMPDVLLARWLGVTRNLAVLARIFDVSEEAMGVKMKKLNTTVASSCPGQT